MRTEIRNRLTMLRKPVALRKVSVAPGNVGWVVVYPLETPNPGYNVRSFEVEESLLSHEEDIWDGVMQALSDGRALTIEEAESHIREIGEDPERLDAPWHVGCPV